MFLPCFFVESFLRTFSKHVPVILTVLHPGPPLLLQKFVISGRFLRWQQPISPLTKTSDFSLVFLNLAAGAQASVDSVAIPTDISAGTRVALTSPPHVVVSWCTSNQNL
jgi:hypothetical protein